MTLLDAMSAAPAPKKRRKSTPLNARSLAQEASMILTDATDEANERAVAISFRVFGSPSPKGSPRVVMHGRGGIPLAAPRVLHDSAKTESWAAEVAMQARAAIDACAPFCDVPLVVSVTFFVVRPAGHYGRGKHAGRLKPSAPRAPRGKPDIDKLVRATLDPLIGVAFDDDSRIVELHAQKVYALLGESPGAQIDIREVA